MRNARQRREPYQATALGRSRQATERRRRRNRSRGCAELPRRRRRGTARPLSRIRPRRGASRATETPPQCERKARERCQAQEYRKANAESPGRSADRLCRRGKWRARARRRRGVGSCRRPLCLCVRRRTRRERCCRQDSLAVGAERAKLRSGRRRNGGPAGLPCVRRALDGVASWRVAARGRNGFQVLLDP